MVSIGEVLSQRERLLKSGESLSAELADLLHHLLEFFASIADDCRFFRRLALAKYLFDL